MTLLLTLLSTGLLCAQTVTKQGVVYTLNGDHYEATAFDAVNADAEQWNDTIRIADAISGTPVTAVAANAFDGTVYNACANKAKAIILGANIKTVGDFAFYLCKKLERLSLNADLQTIGVKALYGCNALESIVFGQSVTTIGTAAFLNCTGLRSLTFKSDNVNIQVSAFNGCSALEDIEFLGTPPQLGSTSFYNTGTTSSPVRVTVPASQLAAYLDKMEGSGDTYSWLIGNGWVSLRTAGDGLRYRVVRGATSAASTLQIVGVDSLTFQNKGTSASPAYIIQATPAVQGYSVTGIAEGTFLTGCDSTLYAIDLRQLPISGLTVSRSAGHFAGIHPYTLLYLPTGNTSTENNVVVGGTVTTALTIGNETLPATAVTSGEATYLLDKYYQLLLFGQQIGTEQAPMPMSDATTQQVWRVDFSADNVHQYRYANTNQTVSLPTADELQIASGTVLSFYKGGWIDQRFTDTTPVTADTKVYAYPQTTSLSLDVTDLTFRMSASENQRSHQLKATALPAKGRQEVTWTSANPSIVTVNSNGYATAVGAGVTTVTATSVDNNAVQASCTFTIIPRVASVTLSENSIEMSLSALEQPVHQLTATVLPANAIQDVIWASQDPTVCTVDANGLVTALKEGKTAVTVTPLDGQDMMSVCYVSVVKPTPPVPPTVPATGITISQTDYTMHTGDELSLQANVLPATAPQQVQWTTSDATVATVSDGGLVKAVGAGEATVTVTSEDNPELHATCRLTVIPRVERVDLSENTLVMTFSAAEQTVHQLTATVYPANAVQDVLWESQDPTICTVDDNGLVTAKKVGNTAVVVIPKDRRDLVTVCYVSIVQSATGLWINRNSYVMHVGEQYELQTKVLPATASQQVEWATSDASVATVSADGVVTALQPGEATITVTSAARPDLNNTCVVSVSGTGTKTTIQGITYQITALSDEARQVTIVHLADSLLQQGGEHTFANQISHTRLDFDIVEVADTAFGQLGNNTLYYVPSHILYKGGADNVIVASDESHAVCQRLVINEDCDFVASHTFTANEVVAKRTHYERLWAFPFSMPYSVKADSRIRFFDMKEQDGDTLVCREVKVTEAYKPYIALASTDEVDLGGTNITVTPYRRNTDVYVGDVQFMSTMRLLDNSYLSGISAFWLYDCSWQPVNEQTVIRPMTAWLASTHQNLGIRLLDSKNNAVITAIRPVDSRISAADTPIYDLSGRRMGGSLENLPKGIYIRNGKKFVKR